MGMRKIVSAYTSGLPYTQLSNTMLSDESTVVKVLHRVVGNLPRANEQTSIQPDQHR
jgi:hypothetical protein